MSFSFSCVQTGLEYRGTDFNTLFAQRRNLVNPGFLRMLVDITRFNRDARRLLQSEDVTTSLDDFLAAGHYSSDFVDRYVIRSAPRSGRPIPPASGSSRPQPSRASLIATDCFASATGRNGEPSRVAPPATSTR